MKHILSFFLLVCGAMANDLAGVRVGAASVAFSAEDAMTIAGGIHGGPSLGQEGELRAIAIVLEDAQKTKVAIVANDILMITRKELDPVLAKIEQSTGIPAANVLINCTHTHHAPSTLTVHGYGPVEPFVENVTACMVRAVEEANARLSPEPAQFYFHLGREETVGQNSRQMLDDGMIYWIGRRDGFVRPTGPFDPEMPVLSFRDRSGKPLASIFNHSTHTIGVVKPGARSPSFYGLATQQMEAELGGTFSFLEGASGSTHNLELNCQEMVNRVKAAVTGSMKAAKPLAVERLISRKKLFRYKVRHFDEAAEEAAVQRYCRKYSPEGAEAIAEVFRNMRENLAKHQGEERETWLQTMLIGDVALVGVPAEYFTKLGMDIKNRSPFRHTYVAELANDWIGYLPDLDGHKLGGYQTWTGYHSFAEPGTGEGIVDAVVEMLRELHAR